MTPTPYRSKLLDQSATHAGTDPVRRRMIYGRIQPMDERPGLFRRLLGTLQYRYHKL